MSVSLAWTCVYKRQQVSALLQLNASRDKRLKRTKRPTRPRVIWVFLSKAQWHRLIEQISDLLDVVRVNGPPLSPANPVFNGVRVVIATAHDHDLDLRVVATKRA